MTLILPRDVNVLNALLSVKYQPHETIIKNIYISLWSLPWASFPESNSPQAYLAGPQGGPPGRCVCIPNLEVLGLTARQDVSLLCDNLVQFPAIVKMFQK